MSAAARTRADRCGCSSASSRAATRRRPVRSARLLPPPTTAGMPRAARARPDQLGLRPLADEHRDVGGRDRARRPTSRRRRAARRCRRRSRAAMCARATSTWITLPLTSLQPVRRTCRSRNGRGDGAPASLVPGWCGRHRAYDDAAGHRAPRHAARPGAARPGRRRCAGWCRGCARVVGGLGGREVGDHVAAAEGVDRLLRVADQHHRGVAGERPVEHLPLHGVGVLELVDEHDPPALAHPLAGRCGVAVEGVGEPAQEVVVGQDRRGAACGGRPRARTVVGERDALRRPSDSGSSAGARAACGSPTAVRGQGQGGGPRPNGGWA